MTGILVANQFVGYKPVSTSLVISEYLGLGAWTHGGEIVGVHLWFVSLLLLCYATAAILRRFPIFLPIVAGAGIAWLWYHSHFAGHFLAFLTGFSFGKIHKTPSAIAIFAVSGCALLLAFFLQAGFACVAVAALTLLSVIIPIDISDRLSAQVARASELSYPFYLVHAPIYLAVSQFLSKEILVVFVVGTLLSGFAAVILEKMDSIIRGIEWKNRVMAPKTT